MSTHTEHPAPDLVILVREDRRGGRTRLGFLLNARNPGLGLNYPERRDHPWESGDHCDARRDMRGTDSC